MHKTKRFLCVLGMLAMATCAPANPSSVEARRDGELATAREPLELASSADDELSGLLPAKAIKFIPCVDAPELECGTLEVPADYSQPWGPKMQLAVIRAPATGPGARIGPLFVNQGGPGGDGVSFVQYVVDELSALRERFDIVSFDPRGVGLSTPTIHCDFIPPPPPAPGDTAGRAQYLDEYSERFAQACLAQTGPVVTKMTTNNTARDIDRLRAALGESKISYHGVSYGSALGAAYASLFPHRVRAMILDGGVPDTYRDYTIEAFLEEAAMHELSLQRVDRLCRGDASCPLHDRSLVGAVDEILAKLRANPVPAPNGASLTEADAAFFITIQIINERSRLGRLPAFVAEALQGNYARWFPFAGIVTRELDVYQQWYAAIFCNDMGSRKLAADFMPLLESAEVLYPRIGKSAELELLLRTCQKWPAADPPIFRNVGNKVAKPILIVANDFDPSTPINWSRHLARTLGMENSLLRYQGGGHTATTLALRGVPCVDEIAMRYLVDLELPPPGFTCPAIPITWQQPQ